MVFWNTIFEIEQMEKLVLVAPCRPHHYPPPPLNESAENHGKPVITSLFQQRRPKGTSAFSSASAVCGVNPLPMTVDAIRAGYCLFSID
jgi:hypothetical protein